MNPLPGRTIAYLAIDVVLLACCLLRIPDLESRARSPFDVLSKDGAAVVADILSADRCPDLSRGDQIITFAGVTLLSDRDIEFLVDSRRIGERVPVLYRRGPDVRTTTIELIPYFSTIYIVVAMAIGLATMAIALYVLVRRPRDATAGVLHGALFGLGACVILAWEGYTASSFLGYVNSVAFYATYNVLAVAFLLFTTQFPRPKFGRLLTKRFLVAVPALCVTVPLMVNHIQAVRTLSLVSYERYLDWFDTFHTLLIVYVVAGIVSFVHSYLLAGSPEERKKLKWVLFGLCVGPFPFLLFTVLPMTVAPQYLIPESYTLPFLLAIPASFAISFMEYHLLDIDLVINRATVYAIVIGVLLLLYVGVVGTVAGFVGGYTHEAAVLAAVVVALLFQPLRERAQRFVDKQFFRVKYNFREAQRYIVEEINRALNVQHLAELVVPQVDSLFAAERIGFCVVRQPESRLQVLAQRGLSSIDRLGIRFDRRAMTSHHQLPLGLVERLESGVPVEPADQEMFHRWKIVLGFPMLSEQSRVVGYLILGEKKSGSRYTIEDVDLLRALAIQSGLAIERLELQERLVLEHAEKERLETLNRMKSDFVSYVSHELRTPLTTIKMFGELLGARLGARDRKGREYLSIIDGESDRLNRMVTTILNSSRIEQGLMQYTMEDMDLRSVAAHVMDVMGYQLSRQGFRVSFRSTARPLLMLGDRDAVADAIINLIGNSIKYSAARKRLAVTVKDEDPWVSCAVRDEGIGISADALPHLFDRFYRDPQNQHGPTGLGLGLALVKHIIDAHHGTVSVESRQGKGSTFVLKFPRRDRSPDSAVGNDDSSLSHD